MLSITDSTRFLREEFGLTPVIAAEIECYVLLAETETQEAMDHFWGPVHKAFLHEALPILRIEKERGFHQYEIITAMSTPAELAETLRSVRAIIEKYAARFNVPVSFAAKPFIDQPSSGMHLHLHLSDENGINVFHKTEEWTSDYLRHSLGGLLDTMASHMPIFFPDITDYARLNDPDHVPKIFGWGVNNRYCALRIPAYPDPYDKRIEHRVPCANADPQFAIAAMLTGVVKGLREQIEPPEQQHGRTGQSSVKQLVAAGLAD